MHMHFEKKADKPPLPLPLVLLILIALAFVAFNGYTLFNKPSGVETSAPKPPVLLVAPNCPDCFPLSNAVGRFFPNASTLSFSEQSGSDMASRYSITKLPALIVFDASSVQSNPQLSPLFSSRQDAFVLEAPSPPFFDTATSKVKGRVEAITISPLNCSKCTAPSALISELNNTGVSIQEEQLSETSQRARELIGKYNLSFLPAFIFSSDLLEYSQFSQSWNVLGSRENDGFLVMRRPIPPVKNLSTNATEGLVSVTYITDATCTTCYNVSIHDNVLKNFNIYIANKSFFDIASLEAQALIEKYNVSKVPTIILSREAGVYYALVEVWRTVGSIEDDGALVFKNLDSTAGIIYNDLANNTIVTVPRAS